VSQASWFAVRQPLSAPRARRLVMLSFLTPLLLWGLISYLPFVWHPFVQIEQPGSVEYFTPGMLIEKEVFAAENAKARTAGKPAATGALKNPIYLPAPHEVARALVTAFRTPPRLPSEPWLHQSLWQSIQVIFWGFTLSSLFGVPLGILCGTFNGISRFTEPFIEFFRYLPAPAFGALAVAVLGIYDAPKIAIIFIGTFFQQVLVVANTTRKLELPLIEAAQTLGAKRWNLVRRVVVPGIIVDLYTDMRVLLGWAWTYLIVAEMVGTTSGITYFINQQARYRNYENVYAAIIIIGAIGLTSDLALGRLGQVLFPWRSDGRRVAWVAWLRKRSEQRSRADERAATLPV
jgi:NitT/TauT family transport system permease protein